MGNKKWTNRHSFLIGLMVALAVAIIAVGVGNFLLSPVEVISPLTAQVAGEEFDNLDGVGEIKWYDGFFTWNPRAQVTSYPFITGTYYIHWADEDTGLSPASTPYTITQLIVDLELRGTETYTQQLRGEIHGQPEPGTGLFDTFVWVWGLDKDIKPGIYDEYIKVYWLAGDEIIPVKWVRDGQIVEPVTNFVKYRENLVIPHMTYLPIVGKSTPY